jgi:type VI secretion system secreted protein Hcp
LGDFHFVSNVNKASPKLFQACATGEHIKQALLTCRKAGKDQQEYLKIKLSDLLVSSVQQSGSPNGAIVPQEQVTINFAKIQIEYHEQKPDGTLAGAMNGGWDAKANKVA